MWVVMKAMSWSSMNTELFKFETPETGIGQPQRFIPIFDLRSDAEQFAGEEEAHLIREVSAMVVNNVA